MPMRSDWRLRERPRGSVVHALLTEGFGSMSIHSCGRRRSPRRRGQGRRSTAGAGPGCPPLTGTAPAAVSRWPRRRPAPPACAAPHPGQRLPLRPHPARQRDCPPDDRALSRQFRCLVCRVHNGTILTSWPQPPPLQPVQARDTGPPRTGGIPGGGGRRADGPSTALATAGDTARRRLHRCLDPIAGRRLARPGGCRGRRQLRRRRRWCSRW